MNPKHLARLREQLRPRVDALDLPGSDVASFRKYLEEFRQRPVYLVPRPLGPEIIGIWVSIDTADYIFYEEATSSYHQRHIILHEGCHILQDHQGPALPGLASKVAPHLDPKLIRSLLCRSVFNTEQETEAEVLATLIEERMEQIIVPTVPSVSPQTTRSIIEFFHRNR